MDGDFLLPESLVRRFLLLNQMLKMEDFVKKIVSLSDFAIEFVLWIRVISRKFCSVDRR